MRKFFFQIANRWIRKQKIISTLLFGVNVVHKNRIHWDFTTLALKSCLLNNIEKGQKVLEIGTGPHAILSLFLAKNLICDITASDIDKEYVRCARETAKANEVFVTILQSDLFENIKGKFDVIFWNSVYIPRDIGLNLGITRIHKNETDWCGGDSGIDKIKKLLTCAPDYLNEKGKILLGFNRTYLSEKSVADLCKDCGYKMGNLTRKFLNPSLVAVLHKPVWSCRNPYEHDTFFKMD